MPVTQHLKTTLLLLTFYSIAMGFLESAVVVYLRELYYPSGFDFPMVTMSGRLALTEILREAATMLMLVTVACIAGDTSLKRFAFFMYCFAVWDIFYYVFLKILVNWPSSLFTWDILFFIPVVWTGPVIAPLIISITMILLAFLLLFSDEKTVWVKTLRLILAGACIVFLSFIWDFSVYLLKQDTISGIFNFRFHQSILKEYIPVYFNWWLFIAGEMLIMAGLLLPFLNRKKVKEL